MEKRKSRKLTVTVQDSWETTAHLTPAAMATMKKVVADFGAVSSVAEAIQAATAAEVIRIAEVTAVAVAIKRKVKKLILTSR
jgi:hypothetical protein